MKQVEVEVEPRDIEEGQRHNIYFNPVANAIRRTMNHCWIDNYSLAQVVNTGYFWLDIDTQQKLRRYDQGDVFFLPHIATLTQHHVRVRF